MLILFQFLSIFITFFECLGIVEDFLYFLYIIKIYSILFENFEKLLLLFLVLFWIQKNFLWILLFSSISCIFCTLYYIFLRFSGTFSNLKKYFCKFFYFLLFVAYFVLLKYLCILYIFLKFSGYFLRILKMVLLYFTSFIFGTFFRYLVNFEI